jgi:hypothetical protein
MQSYVRCCNISSEHAVIDCVPSFADRWLRSSISGSMSSWFVLVGEVPFRFSDTDTDQKIAIVL